MLRLLGLLVALIQPTLRQPLAAADLASARAGAELLTTRGCVHCHQFSGPANSGPLSRLWKQGMTPTRLAGAIWSHGATMWQQVQGARVAPPRLTRNDAFDLIAFFAASG